MKKSIMLFLALICFATAINAQDYRTGVGFRGGFTNGLTIKHFTHEKAAMEFILASRWRGFEVTALYEVHNQLFETPRLKWFIGFGGHVGFWNGDYTYKYWGTQGTTYTVAGIDGILGIEYSFEEIPINLSLDWKPAYNLIGYTGLWADGGALSVRFIF
jgi:hypothetical protein